MHYTIPANREAGTGACIPSLARYHSKGRFSQVGESIIYVLTDASGATAYAVSAADGSVKWKQPLS